MDAMPQDGLAKYMEHVGHWSKISYFYSQWNMGLFSALSVPPRVWLQASPCAPGTSASTVSAIWRTP